jgi:hypothetical protein
MLFFRKTLKASPNRVADSHSIMSQQVQKQPTRLDQPYRVSPPTSHLPGMMIDIPHLNLMTPEVYADLNHIGAAEMVEATKRALLAKQIEVHLTTNVEFEDLEGITIDLVDRIMTLQNDVDLLKNQIDQTILQFNLEGIWLPLPTFENRLELIDQEMDVFLAEIKKDNNSQDIVLRNQIIDGDDHTPEPLQQIALTIIACKEKVRYLSSLYHQKQQATEIESRLSCCKCM